MQQSGQVLCVALVVVALFACVQAGSGNTVDGICVKIIADEYCQPMMPSSGFICAMNSSDYQTNITIADVGTLAHYNAVRNLTFGLCANKVAQCSYSVNISTSVPPLRVNGYGCNTTVPDACPNHLCANAAHFNPTRWCQSLLTGQSLSLYSTLLPVNALPSYRSCTGLTDVTSCKAMPIQPCISECQWCFDQGFCSNNAGAGKIWASDNDKQYCYIPVLNAGSAATAGLVALLSVAAMLAL
jgi:hypothetical protein